jgi:hypothetical protein
MGGPVYFRSLGARLLGRLPEVMNRWLHESTSQTTNAHSFFTAAQNTPLVVARGLEPLGII